MAIKIIKNGNTKEVFEGWCRYCGCEFEYDERNNELIDALYDMVVKLKEEGVI